MRSMGTTLLPRNVPRFVPKMSKRSGFRAVRFAGVFATGDTREAVRQDALARADAQRRADDWQRTTRRHARVDNTGRGSRRL